jgi:hypothetical protein
VVVEVLKLMPDDAHAMAKLIAESSDEQLKVVALVLTEFGVGDELVFRLHDMAYEGYVAHSARAQEQAAPAAATVCQPSAASSGLGLRFTKECNQTTVYHQIVKPFPTLEVLGDGDLSNLHIHAELFRSDEGNAMGETLPYLEGAQLVPVKNRVAIFKKLKVSLTTTSIGAPVVIRFSLVRGPEKEPLGVAVVSKPITVYSHTNYLRGGPAAGKGGQGEKDKPEKKKRKKDAEDKDEAWGR